MRKIIWLSAFLLLFAPGCAMDRWEYEELKATQEDYRAQLTETRQANETINRNITAAFKELETLKAQLAAIPPRSAGAN